MIAQHSKPLSLHAFDPINHVRPPHPNIVNPLLIANSDHTALYDLVYNQTQVVLAEIESSVDLKQKLYTIIEEDWLKRKRHWPYTLLPLLTCAAVGGEWVRAANVAAAWNLLHLAARILDDLADEGNVLGFTTPLPVGEFLNMAIALLGLAQRLLDRMLEQDVPLPVIHSIRSELSQVLIQACSGQHQDLVEMSQVHFGLDDYWQVIEAKTGAPFGWACWAGAMVGNGNTEQTASCQVYGFNLGVLIQLFDDWAGLGVYRGTSDLALHKKTLPVLYALSVLPARQRESLAVLLAEAGQYPALAEEARTEIVRLGGLQYTLIEAEIRRQRAWKALASLPLGPVRTQLLGLLDRSFPL